ncbi:ABC transporter substrate-binding protein [Dactylosporangium sp. CA-233914]|uniref:ABC transporter substrate-binding protein n=1 Tax=Dactylosporangium sp. CA-233914 TaxID=3239934 RepID=UPI003D8F1E8D
MGVEVIERLTDSCRAEIYRIAYAASRISGGAMNLSTRKRSPVLIPVALALLVTVSACGGGGDAGKPAAEVAADDSLRALVPSEIAARGTIEVAGSADFPPDNFLDTNEKDVIGYNAEMLDAIAAKLGLKINFTRTKFTGVITGIEAGRFDAGISFLDTKERQKAVDILDTYRVSQSFITLSDYQGDPIPCGKRVGVGAGSAEALIIEDLSKKECVDAGKPAIEPAIYPSNPQAVVALTSQRVDAVFASTAPAAYAVKQAGSALKLFGDPRMAGGYTGIAVAKNKPELRDAMKAALQELMDDGTYRKILEKWNVQGIASDKAVINAGTD